MAERSSPVSDDGVGTFISGSEPVHGLELGDQQLDPGLEDDFSSVRHQQLVMAWVIERLGADEAGDTASWTAGLTADALNEIRAVAESTTTATHNHP